MMLYSNQRVQFAEYKKKLDQLSLTQDYQGIVEIAPKAMECCQRAYEEATDVKMKDLMANNASEIKKLYKYAKGKLEEQGVKVPTSTKKPGPRPNQKTQNANPQGGGNGSLDSLGDVCYEFNEINVKNFLTLESNEAVTFDDVVGMEEEKRLIKKEFFVDARHRALAARTKKKNKNFIMLYGVPGTGKTFFAKAISYELQNCSEEEKVPFFSIVGSQLKDSKVGVGEKNIIAVFSFCKQFDRCVLFIDEFDALVPDRKKETGDPTAVERVTTFLQMMDGFNSGKGTLVIAATNCPYNLDGGITSRCDLKIEIPLPSVEVIHGMIERKIGYMIEDDVNLDEVAKRLEGYSSRDITKFVGALGDKLDDKLLEDEANGIYKEIEEYNYTNEMIDACFDIVHPDTKKSDLDRIKKYKEKGE